LSSICSHYHGTGQPEPSRRQNQNILGQAQQSLEFRISARETRKLRFMERHLRSFRCREAGARLVSQAVPSLWTVAPIRHYGGCCCRLRAAFSIFARSLTLAMARTSRTVIIAIDKGNWGGDGSRPEYLSRCRRFRQGPRG